MNIRKFKKLFVQSGLKEEELSVKSGIDLPIIEFALSGGDITVSSLEAISAVLGVSPAVFFDTCKGNTTTNNYYMTGEGSQVNGDHSHHNSYTQAGMESLKKENELLRKSLADKEHIIKLMQDASGKEVRDE